MRHILFVGLVAAICMGVHSGFVGGFSPVDEGDTVIVKRCEDKILETLQKEEEQANSCYKVKVTMPEKDVKKQVVNGMNYKFTFTKRATYEIPMGSNCLPKKSVDMECTATVYKDHDDTKPLEYLSGEEPKCN